VAASFLALYRGESVSTAKLLAVSADREVVRQFAARLLETPEDYNSDPVIAELEDGRRRALRLVQGGTEY
jgi:hypothetical protein